jgi:REP element-mobilizing transposase RayT
VKTRSTTNRRKPQRLREFDYSDEGAYFFTICVKDRVPMLGTVKGERVTLSEAGKLVQQTWKELPGHYNEIGLDEFMVMPNHVHGIIWILGRTPPSGSVGEGLRPSPTKTSNKVSLPEVIRAFKSFSAREVNKLNNTSGLALWQRGYHEHVLRNDDDLYQHRAYIVNNPLKWELDEYHQ